MTQILNENINDKRTLESMLILEENYMLNISTLTRSYTSNKLKPEMRSKLATWMLEVCEEQQCTDELYSLSINILDRLICSMHRVEVYHLQLLGCVALFLSSKLKSNQVNKHFDAYKLIEYTDNSITLEDLLDWELLCLDKLRWDIAALVPNDFVDLFLQYLQQQESSSDFENNMVKKHCYAFTAMCSTEFKFSQYPASMIASACILTAIKGLSGFDATQISQSLAQLANIDQECLNEMKEQIDDLFKQTTGSAATIIQEQEHNSIDELLNDFQFEEDDYDLNIEYNLQLNSYELTREVLNNLEQNSNNKNNKTPSNNNENTKTLTRNNNSGKKKKQTKKSKRLANNINNENENNNIISPAKRNFCRSTYSRRSSSGVSSCATNSTNDDNLYLSNSLSSSSLASLLSSVSSSSSQQQQQQQQQQNNNKYSMSSMLYVTPPQANSLPMPAFNTETEQQQQRVNTRRKCNNKSNQLVIV